MVDLDPFGLFPASRMAEAARQGQSRFYSTESSGPVAGAEASAFLARTSGLDANHTSAYTTLINGLVADGLWSKFDVLYVFATQNSTTALLNLISSSYPGIPNSAPTFTADRGYNSVNGGNAYIDTGFNPATAPSPKFTQNSAHISMWNLTNLAMSNAACGIAGPDAHYVMIYPNQDGTNGIAPLNQTNLPLFTAGDCRGHQLNSRTGSIVHNHYKNAVSVLSDATASATVPNGNIWCCFFHNLSGSGGGNGHQHAMLSIGLGMSSVDATNFYNRSRTYMTSVGVP
jgi:hypothetical protein